MMALIPNRGWNYQTSANGGVTVSTYVNPTKLPDGSSVLVASGVTGYTTTVLSDHSLAENNTAGALALSVSTDGYHVNRELSAGSIAVVPGTPLLIGNSLIQGATSVPYPGFTLTVLSVGPQPGEAACRTTADGA
jgi:hypothetical protein